MMRHSLLALAILSTVFFNGCFVNIKNDLQPLFNPTYKEITVEQGTGGKILLLNVDGAISSGAESPGLFSSSSSTVNQVMEKLAMAKKDSSIKAVLLRVDSPGGGVTASDVIYEALKKYKAEKKQKIYVSMLDMATSGGYYIAMAGDEIYVHPTTITGSIGVIAMFPQVEKLTGMIGLKMEVIKSGENKDMASPFKEMQPEQRAILQNMIDEMYERFIQVIVEGRPNIGDEKLRELADGRIYTAKQAEEEGLVDGIMYTEDIVEKIRKDHGGKKLSVIMYRKINVRTMESVYAHTPDMTPQAHNTGTNVNMVNVEADGLLNPHRGPVFQYLWIP